MNEVPIAELGITIDDYVAIRDKRLSLERTVEEYKKTEAKFKDAIEATLKANGLTIGGGGRYKAEVKSEDKPTVTNWPLLYDYITQNDAFDLLQRRVTENAVKARWLDGVAVPGIDKFPVTKLSITKV